MKNLITIITVLSILQSLSACTYGKFSSSLYKPKPAGMGWYRKDAPPEYAQGWEDGCETGMSTMVQGFYKSFYKYKYNAKLAKDPMYYKAWKDSYTYCRHYSFKYTWDPIDKTSIPALQNKLCVICE